MVASPASVGPPVDPTTGVGNILPSSPALPSASVLAPGADGALLPQGALDALDPGQAQLDDIVIPAPLWPWRDLGAFYTPETWLRMKRDVLGTISQLVIQTPDGPKLVRGNSDGTLLAGLSGAFATGFIQNGNDTVVCDVKDASYVAFHIGSPSVPNLNFGYSLIFEGLPDGIFPITIPVFVYLPGFFARWFPRGSGASGTTTIENYNFIVPTAGYQKVQVRINVAGAGQPPLPVTAFGLPGQTVIPGFGQAPMADSSPVVIASDQPAVPISVGSPLDVSDRSARVLGHAVIDSFGYDSLADTAVPQVLLPQGNFTTSIQLNVRCKTHRGAYLLIHITAVGTGTITPNMQDPLQFASTWRAAVDIGAIGFYVYILYPGIVKPPNSGLIEVVSVPVPDNAILGFFKSDGSTWAGTMQVQLLQ